MTKLVAHTCKIGGESDTVVANTDLAVDMCVLIQSNIEVFLRSVSKCTTLQAKEASQRFLQ